MPWPFIVAIVAILSWAIVESGKRRGGGPGLERALRDALARLDAAEAERARLVQRVENLEAIVTSDRFELDREARGAIAPEPALPQAMTQFATEEKEGGEEERESPRRQAGRRREG